MLVKILSVPIIIFIILFGTNADEENIEIFCNVNGKKAMRYVSEKFLSISIDPAVLLAGVNLSETSLRLARHLKPAYIRLVGPSTEFVKYVDADDQPSNNVNDDSNYVIVTPSVWFGINEWFYLAGLTPVFGINDKDTSQKVWNPKTVLPLLEISNKLNISCYWQLGYDSSNKTDVQYKQDLSIFQQILMAFPERNETWKIVGSDISHLGDRMESILEDLENITTSVMWEPSTLETFPEKDNNFKNNRQIVQLWTTVPKSSEPATFFSALQWAKQTGHAAKIGYDVIFRQPRMYEMFSDSPVYWFSILHKQLMGNNVLEAKTSSLRHNTLVFAHCTKKQNSFVRRGALTVMIVNDLEYNYTFKVTLGSTLPDRTMEVQNYIMTSPALNSTEIKLNGKLLTFNMLDKKNPFEPKIRRAKTSSHIPLSVPRYSIGFFVLPGARIPVCIDKEDEPDLLLQEIEEDQNDHISQELPLHIGSRSSSPRNNILDEITHKMKDELRIDGNYYNRVVQAEIANLKERLKYDNNKDENILPNRRKFFIDRAKVLEKRNKNLNFEKKKDELKKILFERTKAIKSQPSIKTKSKDLELTSEEVEKILKDRAKARAAQRNIVFTEEELQALIQKARKKFSKYRSRRDVDMKFLQKTFDLDKSEKHATLKKQKLTKYTSLSKRSMDNRLLRKTRSVDSDILDFKSILAAAKLKVEDKKDYLLGNIRRIKEDVEDKIRNFKYNSRFKRDINKDLLDIRAEGKKRTKVSQDVNRLFYQKAENDDYDEKEILSDTTTKSSKNKNLNTLIVNPFYGKSKKIQTGFKSEEELQLSTTSEEFKDIEDDLPCIHEFYSEHVENAKDKKVKAWGNHESEDLSLEDKTKLRNLKKTKKIKEPPKDEEFDFRCERSLNDEKQPFSGRHGNEEDNPLNKHGTNFSIYPVPENEQSKENFRIKREITVDNKNKMINVQEKVDALRQIIKSRTKLQDGKKINNLKFPKLYNKHEEGIKIKPDMSMKTRNAMREKHKDVIGHLNTLKEKLNERKSAFQIKLRQNKYKAEHPIKDPLKDKLSLRLKQIRKNKPIHLESRIKSDSSKLKDVLDYPSQMLLGSPMPKTDIHEKDTQQKNLEGLHQDNVKNTTIKNVENTSVKKVQKRSIINIDKKSYILGKYQPLTQNFKPWRPSDIRFLNSDVGNFNRNIPKPSSDYYIFKRLSHQNRKGLYKRSIIKGVNSFENEIDSDFNTIRKEGKVHSKIQNKNKNFVPLSRKDRYEKESKNINIIETTQKDDTTIRSNISKIPLEGTVLQEPTILQSFISNLFKIVSKIGQHIGNSVKNIAFN